MAKIPALDRPGTLRPHFMAAIVTGQTANARLPLSHIGALPRGAIVLSLANYTADTASTADADPGAGNLRWNNATQASATEIYLSDTEADASDHSGLWAALNPGGYLYLYQDDDLDVWQQWYVDAVFDGAGYLKLELTLQASNGSFADDAAVVVTLQQPEPPPAGDRSTVTTVASSSGAVTLDWSTGDYFKLTLTENVTNWAVSNPPGPGRGFTLMVQIDTGAGGFTVAKPGTTVNGGALAVPSAAGQVAVLAISSFDNGATLRSNLAGPYL